MYKTKSKGNQSNNNPIGLHQMKKFYTAKSTAEEKEDHKNEWNHLGEVC